MKQWCVVRLGLSVGDQVGGAEACRVQGAAGVGVPVEEDDHAHVVGVGEGGQDHQVPPLMAGAHIVHLACVVETLLEWGYSGTSQ